MLLQNRKVAGIAFVKTAKKSELGWLGFGVFIRY
jgi:hypothetical protein